ncbi:hypothetical protein HDV03_001977 [Kappamyces sp. JEL0829]|nr:hypothetical protein HDV03_001977 [Kappamyces sp. JEL0829]KAJ3357161.1 hypothetical protein HDU91_005454 [Kappamyces sp. JEL0680]
MWKATATLDQKTLDQIAKQTSAEDDWDSDPTFVNNVSEKDQRWGNQKTIVDNTPREALNVNMSELRQKVVQVHDEKALKEWEPKKSVQPKVDQHH